MKVNKTILILVLTLGLATAPVAAADWDADNGEQWYDPADWFDTEAGVAYEYDEGDLFYYDYYPDDDYPVELDQIFGDFAGEGPSYDGFDTYDDLWDTQGYWDLDYDDYVNEYYESDLRREFEDEALNRPFIDDDTADYTYFDEYDDYDFGQEYEEVTRDRPSPYRRTDFGNRNDARLNRDFESDVPRLPDTYDEDAADYTYFDEYDDYDFGQDYEEVTDDYGYEP